MDVRSNTHKRSDSFVGERAQALKASGRVLRASASVCATATATATDGVSNVVDDDSSRSGGSAG